MSALAGAGLFFVWDSCPVSRFTFPIPRARLPLSFPALAHRARTAFLALALRCSGVILAARAGPPFLPPFRPRATAAGFLFLAMVPVYVSALESHEGSNACTTRAD